MSAIQEVSLPYVGSKNQAASLQTIRGQLERHEIKAAAQILKGVWPEATDIHFKGMQLEDPRKDIAFAYLDSIKKGKETKPLERRVRMTYYIRNTVSIQFSLRILSLYPLVVSVKT